MQKTPFWELRLQGTEMVEAYIALGSNVGDRESNIKRAMDLLKEKTKLISCSSLYETRPMYMEEQGWFLNAAAEIETDFTARQLLDFLKRIEKTLGRKPVERNGPRIIDLDILFYGDQILKQNGLQVPHPKMAERAFVLVPLVEIAPTHIHPVQHKTISRLLSELNYSKAEIKIKKLTL